MFRAVLRPLRPVRIARSFSSCKLLYQDAPYARLHPLLKKKVENIVQEYDELNAEAMADAESGGFDPAKATKLARMSVMVDNFNRYKELEVEMEELSSMLSDPQLVAEAEAEIDSTKEQLEKTANALQTALVPQNPFVDKACMLELRPGVGGSEAMIFAHDLLSMYQNYALKRRWPSKVLSISLTPGGTGITEAILQIDQPGAYERLQYEGGVHRVQRVPDTESKGRVHTSTAAVVVLPQMNENVESAEEAERVFAPGEVRVDVMRARGSGGQHVNTTDSAVRLTHNPTGLVVSMQDERSQHKNKAKAFMILRAKLAERERIEKEEQERKKRTDQVTSTNRSDKIRTYNYPQNRITDHRCGFSFHKLEECMAGESKSFDELVDAMDQHAKTEGLKLLLQDSQL